MSFGGWDEFGGWCEFWGLGYICLIAGEHGEFGCWVRLGEGASLRVL